MISIFKQYKILKEIKLKTEEVNKLMKNLYRHEGKYLEALYKYSNYNEMFRKEKNIKKSNGVVIGKLGVGRCFKLSEIDNGTSK